MDLISRIRDLAERSRSRNIYTYSDFLTPSEQAEVVASVKNPSVSFYGGAEDAERKIACFGSEEELFYPPEFPVELLRIKPTGEKFAGEITHRDVLGATLNLGVERSKIGDISIDGKTAYMAVYNTISQLLKDELKRVGRTVVEVDTVDCLPQSLNKKLVEKSVSVASPRADAVVGAAYNLSRDESAKLFITGRVAVNGREFSDGSKKLKIGDVISVRGFGKFEYLDEGGLSRKGKLYIRIGVYA